MALSARRQQQRTDIWPGFVDALATLLMVVIFLLMIFVLAQFFLSEALSGRDQALDRLRSQVSELADLLADAESDARIGAARAIGFAGREASHPLLRYKVLVGDADARVIYECFVALLRLDPQSSLLFVADHIRSDDPALAEAAALALGESGLVEAFPVLQAHWTEVEELSVGRAILLALTLLRHKPATDFLVALLAEAPIHQAVDSLGALDLYRHDEELWRRVEETVAKRGDARLLRVLAGV